MSNKENYKAGSSKRSNKKLSVQKNSSIVGGAPWLTEREGSQNTFSGPGKICQIISSRF